MARVLNSITLDAPASPVSADVSDTFPFTGTPGFTGGGGVQRYDFKWQVDSGGGYVTIGASGTGLITADTNPVINTNSSSPNSITVSCDQPGSYTIRMVGAPTSGGSYTVLSSTQTVEVAAAAIIGDLAATEGPDTAAASGTVAWAPIEGDIAVTEAADIAAFSGDVVVSGDLAATEGPDVLAASGTVADPAITGDLAVTEGADSAALAGDVIVGGVLASSDVTDTAALVGAVVVSGGLSAT
jgi:hypothetical protein